MPNLIIKLQYDTWKDSNISMTIVESDSIALTNYSYSQEFKNTKEALEKALSEINQIIADNLDVESEDNERSE